MTQYDENIRKMLEQDEQLPAVVADKWAAGLLEIQEGRVAQKSGGKPLRVAIKSLSAVAAALVLLFSVALINPVFAQNVPLLGDIIGFLKSEQSKGQTPLVVQQVDAIEEGLQPVSQVTKTTKLSVRESYCDKNFLVLTLCVEPDDALSEYTVIYPRSSAKINGIALENGLPCGGLEKREDGTFVGAAMLDVSDLDLGEEFRLELSLESADVVDASTYVLDATQQEGDKGGLAGYSVEELQELVDNMSVRERQQLAWAEKREEITLPALSFSGTVKVDESLQRIYEVNEEENGCGVNSVTVSPSSTLVDVTIPEDSVYTVTDNMGNTIMLNKMAKSSLNMYDPLYKGTTAITFSFYALENRSEPLAVFEVPIAGGGYAEKWEPTPRISEEDITYIPSLPEIPKDWLDREPEDKVVQFGETVSLTGDFKLYDTEVTQEFTYSNMQVFDSAEAAGVDRADMNDSYLNGDRDVSTCKFVTLDLHVKNLGGTTNGVYLGDYGGAAPKYPYLMHEDSVPGELAYITNSGKGVKNFYFSEIPDMTEYEGTVGFYWNEEDLKAGNLELKLTNSTEDGVVHYLHIELPPYEG